MKPRSQASSPPQLPAQDPGGNLGLARAILALGRWEDEALMKERTCVKGACRAQAPLSHEVGRQAIGPRLALGSLCGTGLCRTVACGRSVALRPPMLLPPSRSDPEAPEGRASRQHHLSLALTLCIWGVARGLSSWCGAAGSSGSPETWQGAQV